MHVSRRALIGGGAALAGAGAVTRLGGSQSIITAGARSEDDYDDADVEALDVAVMISINDAKAGELEILVGEQAISHTDRRLVNRLLRAAREEA
ncbi:MAG TPA: hypothetical protein VES40_12770 [Ilumatobacteraceae bacterium]|nr:hypothetical protein [Ilumatobacteraceae bacterium]